MKGLITSFGVVGVVVFIIALLCLGPLITLWSFNTLMEEAGSSFYIPHTFWSYVATIGLGLFVRGGK